MKTLLSCCIVILTGFVDNVYLTFTPELTIKDSDCFPYNFNLQTQGDEFAKALVMPYLDVATIVELSTAPILPGTNIQYNKFISCMWKRKQFLTESGVLNDPPLRKALISSYASMYSDLGLDGRLVASDVDEILTRCKRVRGTNEVKVIITRNCILRAMKEFVLKYYHH